MRLLRSLLLFVTFIGCALSATYHNGQQNKYLKPKHTETFGTCDDSEFIGNRVLFSSPFPNKALSESLVFPQVNWLTFWIYWYSQVPLFLFKLFLNMFTNNSKWFHTNYSSVTEFQQMEVCDSRNKARWLRRRESECRF